MMPSMFAGVSGLANHQIRLNVIGNNLANINTVGYKYGRVTFQDMMYQTIRSASAPQSGTGGVNPMQVGLGMSVGTIDAVQTPGNLEATGRDTDLAIKGDGFFVMNNGTTTRYSRAGTFDLSTNGALYNPANGWLVMGWQARNGAIDTSGSLSNLVVPVGTEMIGQATTNVKFNGNLNAGDNVALGTVTGAGALLGNADSGALLTGLKNTSGASLGLSAGSVINITATVGGAPVNVAFNVTGTSTMEDLRAAVQGALTNSTVTVQPNGTLRVAAGATALNGVQLSVTNNSVFNTAFHYGDIAGGATVDSNQLLRPAIAGDHLEDLYSSTGVKLDLADGDHVTLLNASVAGQARTNVEILGNVDATTTLGNYVSGLSNALFGAFPQTGEGVAIQPDGTISITGAAGATNAISALDIGAGPSAGSDTRSIFAQSETFAESQAAGDSASYSTSAQAFDSLGNEHSIKMYFTKAANNTWDWHAEWNGQNVGGGALVFDQVKGSLASATGSISLPLTNGAVSPLNVAPDFSTIKQLTGDYTLQEESQNGYAMGTLDKYEISDNGTITGIFTNGLNQLIGQIAIARFANPGGLSREGDNMFAQSTNSGLAQVGPAGTAGRGTIATGNLEMSNVDIAREFTNMIITERGFQANSRVITTSDEMLQELVNLKR